MAIYQQSKICVVSPLGYTGLAYYDHCFCQSLAEIGIEVVLVTSIYRIIHPEDILYSIKNYFVNTYGNLSRIKKGLNYLLCMIKIFVFISRKKFKIVHFQILELPEIDCIIFLLLRIFGIKIVFTPHDFYSFKGKRNNKFLTFMYKICNCLIVHNKANKNLLMNKYLILGDKIKIVEHGNYNYFLDSDLKKDEAREKIGVLQDKKIISFLGNIRSGKGLETLIEALKYLDANSNVLLLIAGKVSQGFNFNLIKTKINNEALKDKVIIHDYFIDDNLIEYYYKSSDVIVVPYEKISESGVLRYAFSCGLPTIVSDIEEFKEFAIDSENCLIFRAGDTVDLAKKLKMVLENEKIAKKIAHNAKKLSDNEWDWKKSALKTEEIYREFQ